MPMYIARFYRAGEALPFHSWAPFGARDMDAAEHTVRANIARNTAVKGTLSATVRFTIHDPAGNHTIEGTPDE
jgi:hypothetical protein